MSLRNFLHFATTDLKSIRHPYSNKVLLVENPALYVWVIDAVLRQGAGPYESLKENFNQSLNSYFNAPRHKRAIIRGAIERLAIHFETFVRTALETVIPDQNIVLYDKEGVSRGKLSQTGYLPDILKNLCGIGSKLGKSGASYWSEKTVEEAIYGVCFRHQQRAKHEARDYELPELEKLANHILGSYIIFARWLFNNSNIGKEITQRQNFSQSQALLFWPEIISYQLEGLRLAPYDSDLIEWQDLLKVQASELVQRAKEMRDQGVDLDSKDLASLYVDIESLAYEYEGLIADYNMREYGREREADLYM